jgi:hypothetical protein
MKTAKMPAAQKPLILHFSTACEALAQRHSQSEAAANVGGEVFVAPASSRGAAG